MNTTSMEFVIAQEKTKKSPSVLSEFMGISKNMDTALQVNPWSLGVREDITDYSSLHLIHVYIQDVAAAMNQGLIMSEEEKARRHDSLYRVVTTHTSHTWAAVLVKMLLTQINTENTARQTPFIPSDKLQASYHSAEKRLLLFDYDVRYHFGIFTYD